MQLINVLFRASSEGRFVEATRARTKTHTLASGQYSGHQTAQAPGREDVWHHSEIWRGISSDAHPVERNVAERETTTQRFETRWEYSFLEFAKPI